MGSLTKLYECIHIAKREAADQIYHLTNAASDMGFLVDGVNKVDFHGLDLAGAQRKLEENVFPLMAVCKKLVIVTGRGAHSESGTSVLKEFVLTFTRERNYQCVELSNNPGALLLALWGVRI